MPASPSFSINGGDPLVKASVSASGAITATLDSIVGVEVAEWSIAGTDETSAPGDYTLTTSGSIGETVSMTALGAGTAAILQCKINSGRNLQTDQADNTAIARAKFYVPTAGGYEVGCKDEQLESNATYGYTGLVNAAIRGVSASGVVSVIGTAPITSTGGANPEIGIDVATPSAKGAMSAADKTRFDAATSAADPNTLVARGASGEVAFGSITCSTVDASSTVTCNAIITPTVDTTSALALGESATSVTLGAASTPTALPGDVTAGSLAVTGAASCASATVTGTVTCGAVAFPASATASIAQARAAAGAGKDLAIATQKGAVDGTNVAGNLNIDLGAQVGGTTTYVNITDGATTLLKLRGVGTAGYITAPADLNLTGVNVQSVASGNNIFRSAQHFFDVTGVSGTINWRSNTSASARVDTLAAAGASSMLWGAGVTSVTYGQANNTTAGATGAKKIVRAQNCTGTTSTGGELSLESGSGTNADGAVTIRANATTRIQANATGLGFNGATPVAKPAVTGSRGGNAALASLLTALAGMGLITDSTTA